MVRDLIRLAALACVLGVAACAPPDGQSGSGGRPSGAYVSGSGGYLTH